jgi:anti-anti-sigma factor
MRRFVAVMSVTELTIRRSSGDRAVVRLVGEHDSFAAHKLERELSNLLDEGYAVEIDLRNAAFIDSQTAGVLLGARRRAEKAALPFGVVLGEQTGWSVRRLLDLTGLGSLLEVAER